jgi:DNA processing protein
VQDTDPSQNKRHADGVDDWIRLAQTPGVGPASGALLLGRFASPRDIFRAPRADLARLVGAVIADALLAPPSPDTLQLAVAVRAWLALPGNHLLTLYDSAYPALLREIADPPLLLYAKGRLDLLAAPAIAVVGSRNASSQGRANARAFARCFAESGLTVVSGLALGIDAAAHAGGLEGPGSTIAVMGTGIDKVYPASNRALAHQIADQGCLLSELPLGQGVRRENFPRRNRLISGLCRGTLVVEAALASGSLITAHRANDQGREVFALPGSIHSPLAKGCHQLIREGAQLVDSAADVLVELGMGPGASAGARPRLRAPDPAQALLLEALGFEPLDAGSLAGLTASEVGALQAQLLALELAGHVERLPGGLYQRLVQ